MLSPSLRHIAGRLCPINGNLATGALTSSSPNASSSHTAGCKQNYLPGNQQRRHHSSLLTARPLVFTCQKTTTKMSSSMAQETGDQTFEFWRDFDPSRHRVQYGSPRQVWLENIDTIESKRLGLKELHPDVFAVYPRMDIIHSNMMWQQKYNKIDYTHVKTVKEMIAVYGGGKKPWPQKGTGRARHGSIRGPQWKDGGKAHGARGPKSHFYMLDYHSRVYGLTMTLSVKFVQDDIYVVKDLEIPTDDPTYIKDLMSARGWAKSVLFVDSSDIMPRNITAAIDSIPSVNLMPAYGMNVLSMTKHHTLVLTESAVDHLTKKLLFALNRTDIARRLQFNAHGGSKDPELKIEKFRPIV